MERIENIGFKNLKLIQDDEGFMFGIDAVILADFAARICPQAKKIVDLGTGNGIIPLILSHKIPTCSIVGFDIQKKAVDIANRNAKINGLTERMKFFECDVKNITQRYPQLKSEIDVVVANPPYVEKGSGIINEKSAKFIARQETSAEFGDFADAAASVLKNKGHLFIVHRPARLVDVFFHCRRCNLEPKDIRFVSSSEGKIPNIVLLHCLRGGGRELHCLEPLTVYESDGNYTSEILKIYEKTG